MFLNDESGATAIEYSLIAAFIGMVIIGVLANVGTELTGVYSDVQTGLQKRPAV
jgi:pilus assembly protein Flp/PilA